MIKMPTYSYPAAQTFADKQAFDKNGKGLITYGLRASNLAPAADLFISIIFPLR